VYTDPYKKCGQNTAEINMAHVPASGVFHDKANLFGIFDHFNQLDPVSMVHLLHDGIPAKEC